MNQCLILVLLARFSEAFLLLFIFGPRTFNFLVKFVSSRIQQIPKWYHNKNIPWPTSRQCWNKSPLSFHGLSSLCINAPGQRPGQGNPEAHNTPVQPGEVRELTAPFPLRVDSQMPEKGNKLDMSRVSKGAKELALNIKRGRNVVTQGQKSR